MFRGGANRLTFQTYQKAWNLLQISTHFYEHLSDIYNMLHSKTILREF